MDNIALDLGFIQIYWYSVFIFLGVFFASLVIMVESKKQKLNQDFMINLIFYSVIFGLIGARLYFVLFNLNYYSKYPLEILEVWNGGLAIHGGLIFGLLTVIIYCHKYKVPIVKVLDIAALGFVLGQAIGRWGNFFNQEVYGGVTTLPHLKELGIPEFIANNMYIKGEYRIPLFLYESIWNFAGFIALLIVKRYKYLKSGQLTGVYLIWYSVGRFVLEGLRDKEFSLMLGNIRVAQILSLVLIVVGILFIILCRRGSKFDNLYKEEAKEIDF